MRNGQKLIKRLLEEELIGIVPEGIFPRYCDSMFPREDVIDFMNLPYEKKEEVISSAVWQDVTIAELA